jgi:hypothetical protein
MFFANNRLVVVGRQTGLIFVYNTKDGRLISKLGSLMGSDLWIQGYTGSNLSIF